jgi:hypothetical protein
MNFSITTKCIAVFMMSFLFAMPLHAQLFEWDSDTSKSQTSILEDQEKAQYDKQGGATDDYFNGRMDGKLAATGHPAWMFAGLAGTGFCLLIGVAGIGIAALVAPSPPEEALMGKSGKYVLGYTEAYKAKSRWKNVGFATIGCCLAALINLIINVASGATANITK